MVSSDELGPDSPSKRPQTLRPDPVRSDCDFFASPPSEIGPIVYAGSSLRQGEEPYCLGVRLLASAGIGLGLALLEFVIICTIIHCAGKPFLTGELALFALLFGLDACIVWFGTSFSHECCYVGTAGVARYGCAGSRKRLVTSKVLLFKDAIELRASTSMAASRFRSWRFFHRDWRDVHGKSRFEITYNRYTSSIEYREGPLNKIRRAFAHAAEEAWNKYQELKRTEEKKGSGVDSK